MFIKCLVVPDTVLGTGEQKLNVLEMILGETSIATNHYKKKKRKKKKKINISKESL